MLKTWIKILFSLLLGVVLLVLVAVGFVLTTYDDEDYRQKLTDLVALLTDYTLTVDGPFRAHISFFPSVSVSAVTLSSDDSADIYVFDSLEFQFALRPLFDGVFQVVRLVIDGGTVMVTVTADEADEDGFGDEDLVALLPNMVLSKVSISNIDLTFKQEQGEDIRVRLDNFAISDVLNHKPLSFTGRGSFADTPFSMAGQFGSLAGMNRDGGPYPVKLEFHSGLVDVTIAGAVADVKRRKGLDFLVKADIADVIPVLERFKLQIPLAGRLQARGLVRGDLGSLSLADLDLTVSQGQLSSLQVAGAVQDLSQVKGVKVQVSGAISEPQMLKWLLPVDLYAINNLIFAATVASQANGYLISDLTAQGTNTHGLQVDMSGHGLLDNFKAEQPFGDLDVLITVVSPDTASVQGYLLDDLPELGGAEGSVRLTAPTYSDLAVEDIDVRLGRSADLMVSATGRIDKIPLSDVPNSGIDLQLEISANRTERVGYLFAYPLPELGPVSLQGRYYGSKSSSRLSDFKARLGRQKDFQLSADGELTFNDFSSETFFEDINLAVVFSGSAQSISSLTSFDLSKIAPFSGDGVVQKDAEKGVFDGKFLVGQTELTAHVSGNFTGERPLVEGRIAAPVLHLADFGFQPHEGGEGGQDVADAPEKIVGRQESQELTRIFSQEPLSWDFLQAVDLSLDVSLHKFGREGAALSSIDVGVNLHDGLLTIDPAAFMFKGGSVKANMFLDSMLSPPQMNIEVTASEVDLGSTLAYLQKDVQAEGDFTLYADLTSSGFSAYEIAANMMGDVEMVLDQGRVPRYVMDLLTVDLLGWSISKTIRREKYVEIRCGVVDLQLDGGIVESTAIVFDSPRVYLTGAGSVDLGAETIDLALYPKKKKKFWSTITPVHIKGPLSDPAVKAIPAKSTGIAAGGVLLAPQFFLPAAGLNYLWEVVSKDKDNGNENPCLQELAKNK